MRSPVAILALLALTNCTTGASAREPGPGQGTSGGSSAVEPASDASATTAPTSDASATSAPVACEGTVGPSPEGARPVEDPALLALAVGAPDAGKLCTATVFEATRPITVFRVWQRDRPYTERGRWWSLTRPAMTRAQYRADNVICPEWSALDVLSQCTLRAGARFAMGPGQSVRCADGALLPRAATNQVFIDNDTRQNRVFVEDCRELGPFQ